MAGENDVGVEELIEAYEKYKSKKITYGDLRERLRTFVNDERVISAVEKYSLRENYDALFLLEEISTEYRVHGICSDPQRFLRRFEKERRKALATVLRKVRKISVEKDRVILELKGKDKEIVEKAIEEHPPLKEWLKELFLRGYEIKERSGSGPASRPKGKLKELLYFWAGCATPYLLPLVCLHEFGHALAAYLSGVQVKSVSVYPLPQLPIFAVGGETVVSPSEPSPSLLPLLVGGAAAHQAPFSMLARRIRKTFLNYEKVKSFLFGVASSILLGSLHDGAYFFHCLRTALPEYISLPLTGAVFGLVSYFPYLLWSEKKFDYRKTIEIVRRERARLEEKRESLSKR